MRRKPQDEAAILAYARSLPDITCLDVGRMSLRFNLNLKATFTLLENSGLIAHGYYDDMKWRGITVAKVYERVKQHEEA